MGGWGWFNDKRYGKIKCLEQSAYFMVLMGRGRRVIWDAVCVGTKIKPTQAPATMHSLCPPLLHDSAGPVKKKEQKGGKTPSQPGQQGAR